MATKRNHKRKNYKRKGGRARAKRWGARAGSMAYTAYKMASKLMDAVNIEYKEFNQYSVSAINPDNTGAIIDLCTVAQGVGNAARIGDSMKLQNLTLRYQLFADSATASDLVRVIVFHDKENSISTVGQFLAYQGNPIAPLSPKNEDNKYNTKTLHDQVHSVMFGATLPHRDLVIPLNFHQHYQAGTTTIKDGALKMIVIAANASSVTDFWYQSQVSFTDN